MSIVELLRHRLVLVTGKGGVGKSTCALALALAACRQGKRVLLCELGSRPVSSEYLGSQPARHLPDVPLPHLFSSLWTAHLDPRQALQEYLLEHLHAPRLVKLATENRILARLWQAAPSVNEVSVLNSIYQLERARQPDGWPRFDLIVVDMPATGHALAMLGVPRGAVGLFRVGPLAERVKALDQLLHNRQRTAVCIVTLPEELPVNESIDLAERLRNGLGIEPAHVVVNRVLPELLEEGERRLFDKLAEVVEDGPGRTLLDSGSRDVERRRAQLRRIEDLRARMQAEITEVGSLARCGLSLVTAVADTLAPA